MSDLKEEKRQAKEQDKNFVDYRIQEVLHKIKPRTKAFNLQKFDDTFPRPAKNKSNMEFGELMHKYLTMRPDGRFATWQGKPAKKKKAQASEKKTGLMKKMQLIPTKTPKEAPVTPTKKVNKNYDLAVKKALIQQADVEDDELDQRRLTEARQYLGKDELDQKVKYNLNAIVENKPFWLVGDPVVPEDEEEAYVDAEMLTNYVSNPGTTQFIYNEEERKQFFIWGPIPQLFNEMQHFANKKLIIGNTLKSIIESTADRKGIPKERVDKGHKPILKWNKKTRTIEYVMESVPLEKTAIYEGKLQWIFKVPEKKE
uniref:DUF1738 domain-containing protein n=1 Tax=Caenorhabditis tropicalis TaxID=1561998 RepID=A0A1I7U501_9PELO